MTKLLRPTSGAAWRQPRTEGVPVELPSGNIVLLRSVSPLRLAEQGEMIDILTPVVQRMLFGNMDEQVALINKVAGELTGGQEEDAEQIKRAMKDMAEIERIYNAVCVAAFVSPRIVDDPQADDEISLDDIDAVDKSHVYIASLRGATFLKLFRYETPPDVATVPDSEDDGQPAIGPDVLDGQVGGAPV